MNFSSLNYKNEQEWVDWTGIGLVDHATTRYDMLFRVTVNRRGNV